LNACHHYCIPKAPYATFSRPIVVTLLYLYVLTVSVHILYA